MFSKDELVGNCSKCNGVGVLYEGPCSCMVDFRTAHWMVSGGFSENSLEFCYDPSYVLPVFKDNGSLIINKFLESPVLTESKGLSLFITSYEKGAGKTTLAHYLAFHWLRHFFEKTERYSRSRKVGFQFCSDFIEKFDEQLWKRRFFVLDDMGSENISAVWLREDMVSKTHQMLQYRRNHNLPTIITSNLSASLLSDRYKGELDSVLEIIGDTIGGGVFKTIQVDGSNGDFRLEDKWEID